MSMNNQSLILLGAKCALLPLLLLLAISQAAPALTIEGSLAYAIDIPRIYGALRLPGETAPMTGSVEDIYGNPVETFTIEAYFDTGSSGVLISDSTANMLEVPRLADVTFEDVGVAGTDEFAVSAELFVHLATFGGDTTGIDDPASFATTYNQQFGPVRTQLSQPSTVPGLEGTDIFGMPLFIDKTVVMDMRAVNQILGTIVTSVHNSGEVIAGLPAATRTVATSYGDFSRFTQTVQTSTGNPLDPAVFGPTMVHNPFIGPDPDPTGPPDPDAPPGITVVSNGVTTTSSWLLDTGAGLSMLSQQQANIHGIRYRVGHEAGSEDPLLEFISDGSLVPNQYQSQIGGIGGVINVAGFMLDKLSLPTVEGESIDYLSAPVSVLDITLLDPLTMETLTLDGVFGMNNLLASATIEGGFPTDIRSGAYDFVSFDEPSGVLSLVLQYPPGDFNFDGAVDIYDLGILATNYDTTSGMTWETGDADGDSAVDIIDLGILATNYGTSTEAAASATPEPGTMTLIGVGALALLFRRRKLSRRPPQGKFSDNA
ncbi:MAG: PEP-CTERM sorting domain-containing protein [Planctomycetota bacterium]|nr:PEP-CTERM sorting domain-containing protein [Planctomycetota bacterium]